jgi:hypothetical protein
MSPETISRRRSSLLLGRGISWLTNLTMDRKFGCVNTPDGAKE